MIRCIRVFGIPVLTIETTEEKPELSPGDAMSTPMTVTGFTNPTEEST